MTRRNPLLRALGITLLAAYGVTLPACLVPSFLLVGLAETVHGRLAGLAVLAMALLPLACVVARAVPHRRWARLAPASFAVVAISTAVLPILDAPAGESPSAVPVSSRFTGGARFLRWSPANVVPEIDQVRLGVWLAPWYDRWIDRPQAERVIGLTIPLYRAMERDPGFAALGSVMHYAYSDLVGLGTGAGHDYVYRPATPEGRPVPIFLFLHGNAGNFKSYLWAWKDLAEARRVAVVAPSFGWGNWDRPGGVEAIANAWTECHDDPGLDASQVVLAGLSNGGRGVSRAAARWPQRFSGLVFLSALMEPDVLLSKSFLEGWRGRPVLVLHGERDRRIPLATVQVAVEGLRAAGVHIRLRTWPAEDHFLLFSRRDEVFAEVTDWWQEQVGVHGDRSNSGPR